METPDEEIARLEAERHSYSETFRNTAETDTVTRAHLQEEMDVRTARIRELQDYEPFGFLARWGLRTLALAAVWGAVETDWLWARIALGILAAALALYSLA
ncbi:hypothetical protein AB0G74_16800 [Streptomyces sp. NPDC020875]|uniref:hypothetical protein n=1 Tax=Streptomyces sp. NPDC020875 TaxID=3154898 RepID=UPI0034060B62